MMEQVQTLLSQSSFLTFISDIAASHNRLKLISDILRSVFFSFRRKNVCLYDSNGANFLACLFETGLKQSFYGTVLTNDRVFFHLTSIWLSIFVKSRSVLTQGWLQMSI